MLSVFMCFIKILSSSLNAMLIVEKHCCDVCCDLVPQTDRKSKQVKSIAKQKILFAISMGKNSRSWTPKISKFADKQ